jgi:hypothetical protein
MFVTRHQLIVFLVLTLFQFYNSKSIRDEPYFDLFVANPTPAPGANAQTPEKLILQVVTRPPVIKKTTYDWGQWTKTQAPGSQTTYDWGQHTGNGTTYDWGQHTGNGTTYDWGQHTGNDTRTTYDWGQHTGSTSSPNSNSTGNGTEAPASRTTYDWGQRTGSRTTYDWGQHTGSTSSPDGNSTATASRTTYDWGQHTGSRTTYDWGQHTGSTVSPGDDNSTVTENPDDGNEYRCPAGKYTCKGTIGLCISLTQICDRKQDCPHRDDEDPKVCFPGFGGNKNKKKNYNNFAGTGFMFNVRNIIIRDKSVAKLFDQQSDNRNTDVIQKSQ